VLRDWWRKRAAGRPSRAEFVRQILPKGGVGAELGVQKGDFTRELLDIADPERLHLVDLWYLFGKEWHWGAGNRSTVAALKGVLDEFEDELVSGKVALNIGNDLEVLTTFPDRYFDWVYLDTLHMYEHTKQELEVLRVKVKLDGTIAGDDWLVDPNHPHHGVCKAVREFVRTEPYELIYSSERDLQWAIKYAA
jgi:hypothetical protein